MKKILLTALLCFGAAFFAKAQNLDIQMSKVYEITNPTVSPTYVDNVSPRGGSKYVYFRISRQYLEYNSDDSKLYAFIEENIFPRNLNPSEYRHITLEFDVWLASSNNTYTDIAVFFHFNYNDSSQPRSLTLRSDRNSLTMIQPGR